MLHLYSVELSTAQHVAASCCTTHEVRKVEPAKLNALKWDDLEFNQKSEKRRGKKKENDISFGNQSSHLLSGSSACLDLSLEELLFPRILDGVNSVSS